MIHNHDDVLEGVIVMGKRIQFVLTEQQYIEFMKEVEKSDLSISQYIVSKVLPQKTDFETIWSEFVAKLKAFPLGIEFDVAIVMGQDRWDTLNRSEKLSLARLFNRKVSTGEHDKGFDYRKITIIGRSSSNVTRYKKIG